MIVKLGIFVFGGKIGLTKMSDQKHDQLINYFSGNFKTCFQIPVSNRKATLHIFQCSHRTVIMNFTNPFPVFSTLYNKNIKSM